MKSKMIPAIMLIVIFVTVASFTIHQQPKPWPVPDKNSKMPNPVKSDDASIKAGKATWAKHCQSCHGKSGKGDGTKAGGLRTHPGDFTEASVQSETDGAWFYKIVEGREDMPTFKKKIPDQDDIWNIVNYMRTFKK